MMHFYMLNSHCTVCTDNGRFVIVHTQYLLLSLRLLVFKSNWERHCSEVMYGYLVYLPELEIVHQYT